MAVPTAARAKVTAATGLESHRDRGSLGPEADTPTPVGSSGIFGDTVMVLMKLGKIKRYHSEVRGYTRVRISQAYPSAVVWKLTPLSQVEGWGPLLKRATGPSVHPTLTRTPWLEMRA